MGLFAKDLHSMNDLFVHTLRDIYYAENRIVKSLPDMIEKASNPQLKQRSNRISGIPKIIFRACRRCSGCTASK